MKKIDCFLRALFEGLWPRFCSSKDIAFHMRIFKDSEIAMNSLTKLRRFYPDSRIFVVSDGVDVPVEFSQLCEALKVEFHRGERLYTFGTGGRLIHRMLELFMRSPRKWLIKIDPDTDVHRPLIWLPKKEGIFGTVQRNNGAVSIQGGFVGMVQSTAKGLYETNAFLNPVLWQPEKSYVEGRPKQIEYVKKRGISEDWIIGYVLHKAGLPCFHFSEVRCTWSTPVANPRGQFSFTHPIAKKKQDDQSSSTDKSL